MEEKEKTCNCNEECECGCKEGKDCTCEECNCEECSCEDCNEECTCEDVIADLQKQIQELTEKNLRTQAETANYRRRLEEEQARILKYSNEEVIKSLLPIIDNFERAIKLDDENLTDELSKFLEGFKMIYCNLISILEKLEVKAIDGANKPFDATYHQAVLTEKVDGMESDQIVEVLQKGYLYKDKVIRPAMVKVSE